MPYWYTQYKVGADTYGSHVWASQRCLTAIFEQRGLGETLHSATWMHPNAAWPGRVSTSLRKLADPRVRNRPREADVVHALTWLLHLWCRSGVGTGVEATSDVGWFHDAVHLIVFGTAEYEHTCRRPWRWVIKNMREIEASVPGYLPSKNDLGRMSARVRAWWA